jgi:alpha-glucosidase
MTSASPATQVAEAWLDNAQRMARYLGAGELHTAFNFDFLASPSLPDAMRMMIDDTIAAHLAVGAAPTGVLSNHYFVRHVSRYARAQVPDIRRLLDHFFDRPAGVALGTRRARAAILQMVALPGCSHIYRGEELGVPEV